jgi:hypothetical protein
MQRRFVRVVLSALVLAAVIAIRPSVAAPRKISPVERLRKLPTIRLYHPDGSEAAAFAPGAEIVAKGFYRVPDPANHRLFPISMKVVQRRPDGSEVIHNSGGGRQPQPARVSSGRFDYEGKLRAPLQTGVYSFRVSQAGQLVGETTVEIRESEKN